jgi:hypothetical protein
MASHDRYADADHARDERGSGRVRRVFYARKAKTPFNRERISR